MVKKSGETDVGVVGLGSMGGGMAFLFAEHGSKVTGFDAKSSVADDLKSKLSKHDVRLPVEIVDSLQVLAESFKPDKPRIIVLSLPHGGTIDKVIGELVPHLDKGDIIVDGANEWWENTQRRQASLKEKGIYLIGLGVSGGYQAARKGPSMSPGGDIEAYKILEPLFKKWAAKDGNGNPCVEYMGPGGAGHHCKMIHNGIEQGFLGIIAEAWALLHKTLGLGNADISKIFAEWNAEGELRDNYLLGIGSEILQFKEGNGVQDSKGIVDDIADKVVQDVDETEGTGYWTLREVALRHVAAPTIAATHQLRIISSSKDERLPITKNLRIPKPSRALISDLDRNDFIKSLRLAVYGGIFASFIQGYGIIARASLTEGWHVQLANCNRIWRAGCIIQSNAIGDFLQPLLEQYAVEGKPQYEDLLLIPVVAAELRKTYEPLKHVLGIALETDAVVPSLAATLEYIKSAGGEDLPTSFMESEMDYFGAHNYDLKGEHRLQAQKGKHHTEWKPAK